MTAKSDFLKWLADKSEIPASQIAENNGRIFEELFNELEQELGVVSTKDVDPRFTNLFLLKWKNRLMIQSCHQVMNDCLMVIEALE